MALPATELLDDHRALAITRGPYPRVDDGHARTFLRGLVNQCGGAVLCQIASTAARNHIVEVECQFPASPDWFQQHFEYVGPFFAVQGLGRSRTRRDQIRMDSSPWTLTWTRPRYGGKSDPRRLRALVLRVQAWSDAYEWTPDSVGPFVEGQDYFDGNHSVSSVQLPTWPRMLTLEQSAEVILGMLRIPGAESIFVEIGSPLAGMGSEWPLANDLLLCGNVDAGELESYWRTRGLVGVAKRLGSLSSMTQLMSEPGEWRKHAGGLATWTSIHLFPCWLRAPASSR